MNSQLQERSSHKHKEFFVSVKEEVYSSAREWPFKYLVRYPDGYIEQLSNSSNDCI